jgi:ketosteroid isomerase-like protein
MEQTEMTREADRRAILAQLDVFAALSGGREDNAQYLQAFTEDAVILPPERPALQGRAALGAYYDTALESVTSVHVTYADAAIDLDGALATRRYTATAVVRSSSGEPRTLRTKYLDVLKKSDAGWRISTHMWSSNEALRPGGDPVLRSEPGST